MPQGALTSRIISPAVHRVYTRRLREQKALPVGGHIRSWKQGWKLDERLRCERISMATGAACATAVFSHVPEGDDDQAFESILSSYSIDDQVKVVADPLDDELVEQDDVDAAGDEGHVLFEGVLVKHTTNINADERGAQERVGMSAIAMPMVDNLHHDHLVRGRAFLDASGNLQILESPNLPPIPNWLGRPNRHPDNTVTVKVGAGSYDLVAPVFGGMSDDDEVWTIREFLAYLIAVYLVGAGSTTYGRHVDLDTEVANQLSISSAQAGNRPARFEGIDELMPEVQVQGLGVYEAIERVCEAAGYACACVPLSDAQMTSAPSDCRYQLKIWRRGSGNLVDLHLAKRGTTYGVNVRNLHAENDVPRYNGMRDASAIRNHVYAVAPVYIEARFPLLPLWALEDVDTSMTAQQLANATEAQIKADGAAAKHIAGGALFHEFSHVGRAWGLDCTGEFDGYEVSPYQHADGGFDFHGHLDLDSAAGYAKTLYESRVSSGAGTDLVAWQKRLRHVLPCRSAEAIRRGVQWVLEVSEDAGVTWEKCDIAATSLKRYFGVKLSVNNLARINAASLRTRQEAPAAASWWQKILNKTLLFRITCCIEADHAAVGRKFTQAESSCKSYSRAQWMLASNYEECWVWPESAFNESGVYAERVSGWATQDGAASLRESPLDQAKRQFDRVAYAEMPVSVSGLLTSFTRFQLGQQVWGIRGRNVSFATAVDRYPEIVGITYHLGSAESQGIELVLDDDRFAGIRHASQREEVRRGVY